MNENKFGTVRHGDDPTQSPLDWFSDVRHGHSADGTQRKINNGIMHFRQWLEDDFDWIVYNGDDQSTIRKKRSEYGEKVIQHESNINWNTGGSKRAKDLSIDDARDYFHALAANPNLDSGSAENCIGTIKQFYDFCLKRGHSWFRETGNPIELAMDEGANKIIGNSSPRNPYIIPVDKMSEYIRDFDHPLWEAISALLAKTTIRRGVCSNSDLQDIYIDHPACNWDVHKDLRNKERSFMYVPSAPEEGRLWKERERVPESSNKTSVNRTIPLDKEMVDLLLRWLAVHPGPLKSDTPLFTLTGFGWSQRIKSHTVGEHIRRHSEDLGYWYEPYDDDNINAHYFRHWSTSIIDERLESDGSGEHHGPTKLLRGDQEATMDNYTHWSEDRIERYLDICPKFYD